MVAPVIALLTLATLGLGLLQVASDLEWSQFRAQHGPNLLIALALLASAWTDYQICLAFALRGWNVARGLIYTLVALKALPPLIDVVIWVMRDDEHRRQPIELLFAAGSPFGLISVVQTHFSAALVGFGVQLVFAILATIFAGISHRRVLLEPSGSRPPAQSPAPAALGA